MIIFKVRLKTFNFYGEFVARGGNFNLVPGTSLDYYNYKLIWNPKARKVILEVIENFNLKDPWRSLHEDQKQYTRFVPSNKKSRIDFFCIISIFKFCTLSKKKI